MGFHKRFITIDKLQRSFESDGYKAIKQLVSSPDAIVTCDDLSEKIVDVVIHGEHDENSYLDSLNYRMLLTKTNRTHDQRDKNP